jgi:AraC family ethanolamine operon transcriptional activator
MIHFKSFDDFENFENALQGWNPVLRKLDRSRFDGTLAQVDTGPIRVAYTRIGSPLHLSGAAAVGFRSFGLPLPASTPAMWCGKQASSRAVSVYDESGAFEAVTRAGFETLVFSVRPSHLEALAERIGVGLPPRERMSEIVACDPAKLRAVRDSLLGIVRALTLDHQFAEQAGMKNSLEFEIPTLLLEALEQQSQARAAVAPHLRQRALRRALDTIDARPSDLFSVRDLCDATGSSVRTLRRAFVEQLGLSPKAYLQAKRLNGVYRELRSTETGGIRVNEVASRWGFWHMGQLASDYRKMFDELPTETLNRSARLRNGERVQVGLASRP